MRTRFVIPVVAASLLSGYLAGTRTPSAFAAENSALNAEISSSLNGAVLVSKVTLGGRAIATGYQTDWPVTSIVNAETGAVTYRVESGLVRFDVGQREMRQHFAPGSRFRVSSIDLKDDRLELMLEGGSGISAKLRLVLGQGWQTKSDTNGVMTQLARVFDMPNAQASSPRTASSAQNNNQQPTPGDVPVHLEGTVTGGNLLQKIAPIYSPIAKAARVEGTVVLDVVIARDGSIKSATVVSGSPLLVQSAIDAVKQWVYRPFALNGASVEVESKVNVVFSLGERTPSQQNQAATQPAAEPVQREYTCDGDWEQVAYCKKWATDTEHFDAHCRESRYGGLVDCAKVLTESYAVCKGGNNNTAYCFNAVATREEAEIANRQLGVEKEQQRQFQASQDAASFAQRERDNALLRLKERREHEESVAADKASAAKHTTRYRGLYVGEFLENARLTESGCKLYDAYMQTAIQNIAAAKSITECVLNINSDGSISQIMVLTRMAYTQEYSELVGNYGPSVPGTYHLVDGASADSKAWSTKDGTQIAETPQTVTYYGGVTPYTLVLFFKN